MSQAGTISGGGGGGPTVPTQFTTDDGIAIPAANNLNVLGGSGIETYADPNNGDNLYIEIQNSCTTTGTTVGATTADLCTIPLSTAGTYTFESRVSAWETGGTAGGGFSVNGVLRSDGASATVIGDSDNFAHKDAVLQDARVEILASGVNAVIRVTGVAGYTINWGAFSVYINIGVL